MSLLKPSDLFPTENRFARFLAHPLTGITHILAGCAFLSYLATKPAPAVSLWMWLALAVFPGIWVLFGGIYYLMLVMTRGLVSPNGGKSMANLFPSLQQTTWQWILFRREAVAGIMLFSLLPCISSWHLERPFDEENFQWCVRNLGTPGLAALAKTLPADATRLELRVHCGAAYKADQADAPAIPNTPAELYERFKK